MKEKMETNADELSLRAFGQKGGFQTDNINDESWYYFSRLLLVDVFTRKRLLFICSYVTVFHI